MTAGGAEKRQSQIFTQKPLYLTLFLSLTASRAAKAGNLAQETLAQKNFSLFAKKNPDFVLFREKKPS